VDLCKIFDGYMEKKISLIKLNHSNPKKITKTVMIKKLTDYIVGKMYFQIYLNPLKYL